MQDLILTFSRRSPYVRLVYYVGGWRKGEDMGTHPQGSQEQRDYLSYLLRLWRESDEGQPVWRASLKSSRTGIKVGFGSLEELCDFLHKEIGTIQFTDGNRPEP
jgi:hypothetical protein